MIDDADSTAEVVCKVGHVAMTELGDTETTLKFLSLVWTVPTTGLAGEETESPREKQKKQSHQNFVSTSPHWRCRCSLLGRPQNFVSSVKQF